MFSLVENILVDKVEEPSLKKKKKSENSNNEKEFKRKLPQIHYGHTVAEPLDDQRGWAPKNLKKKIIFF